MAKCFQAGPEQSDELLCFFFAFFKIKLRCRLDHKHVKICTDLKLITTKNTLTSLSHYVQHRELSSVLYDDLEGWDGREGVGRGFKRERVCAHT